MTNLALIATRQYLPQGWRRTKLGEVCHIQKGTTPRVEEYAHDGIRIIKFRDIGGRKINWIPGFRSFVTLDCEKKLRQLKVGMTLIGANVPGTRAKPALTANCY